MASLPGFMSKPPETERLDFLQDAEHPYDRRVRWDKWRINNSGLDDYFSPVTLADHPEGVLGIIEEQIGADEGNAGVDIAGGRNGIALRQLLKMGILEKALVTNYRDRRNPVARMNRRLDHVRGDILAPRTVRRIIEWQERHAPEGLALVLHRPDGALQDISPDFYEGGVHLLLDILRPGGLMFTQIPYSLRRGRYTSSLSPICESVVNRPDVESVIAPKANRRAQGPRQQADCVVIVKN